MLPVFCLRSHLDGEAPETAGGTPRKMEEQGDAGLWNKPERERTPAVKHVTGMAADLRRTFQRLRRAEVWWWWWRGGLMEEHGFLSARQIDLQCVGRARKRSAESKDNMKKRRKRRRKCGRPTISWFSEAQPEHLRVSNPDLVLRDGSDRSICHKHIIIIR